MDKEERKKIILDTLHKNDKIKTMDLQKILDVSPITLRKDLKELEIEGIINKSYGYVRSKKTFLDADSYLERVEANKEVKEHIAEKAATLINEGQNISIGHETSCLYLARKIPFDMKISVVATGIYVALELLNKPRIEVFITGGKIFKPYLFISSRLADDFISKMYFDATFFSTDGVVPGEGFFESFSGYSFVRKKILENSKEIYFLVDSSKIGKKSFYKFFKFKENVTVITDKGITKEQIKEFELNNNNLIIAD